VSGSPSAAPSPPPPSLRRTLVKSAAQFSIGTFVAQGAALLRGLLAAHVLGPSVYGIWLGLRLFVDYGTVLDLGVVAGMFRNVPLLRGRGDHRAADEVRHTVFAFVLAMGLLGAIVLSATAAWWPRAGERQVLIGTGAVIAINLLRSYFVSQLRASHRFGDVSLSAIIGGAVAVATIPLIYVAGLVGFVWGMFAQGLAEVLYVMARSGLPRPRLRWRVLAPQLAFGVPATLLGFLTALFLSIDRTVILQKLDAERLGWYGIAVLAGNILFTLSAAPSAVLSPRLAERLGATGRPRDVAPLLTRALGPMSAGFAVFVGMMAIALPATVKILLPKYLPGVDAARIAVLAAYWQLVATAAGTCLIVLNRQILNIVMLASAAAVSYGAARLLMHFQPTLLSVAIGTGFGVFLYATTMLLAALTAFDLSARERLRQLLVVVAPIAFVAVSVLVVDRVVRLWAPRETVRYAVAAEAAFLAVTSPWWWRALRAVLTTPRAP